MYQWNAFEKNKPIILGKHVGRQVLFVTSPAILTNPVRDSEENDETHAYIKAMSGEKAG